jgi:DNA-binding NarL/FixJ family response regulator
MSLARVLVVDDFEDWRQRICEIFEESRDLLVVRLVSDGLEAVRQAQELQPDLIVLDVDLPSLNGIDAARLIHDLCPATRILFLSLNSDLDVVRAALGAGGHGYVLKTLAVPELLAGARAVVAGKQFVGSGLASLDRRSRDPKS